MHYTCWRLTLFSTWCVHNVLITHPHPSLPPPLHLTGVPGAPERPTVSSITPREVLVSWIPVVSILPVTQYNVTWVRVDTEKSNSTVVDADLAQLLLTDLRPNWNYRVTVVAINRVGEGPSSDPADFTTLEAGMSKLRPQFGAFIGMVGNVTACATDSIWLFPPCTARLMPHPSMSVPPQPFLIRLMSLGFPLLKNSKMELSFATLSVMWTLRHPQQ